MSAVTASSVIRSQAGDHTLTIANFANTTDNGDTYASGIQGIVSVMACQADAAAGSIGSTGVGAALTTASTGTITFYIGEDNSAVTLWILSKS